jgi:hypothetical protein
VLVKLTKNGAVSPVVLNAGGVVAVLALAPLLARSIATSGSLPLPLLALGVVLVPIAALRHPRAAVTIGVLVMALPYTWSPNVPKIGGAFGTLVGLALAASAVIVLRDFRMTAVDWFVLIYALSLTPIAVLDGESFHLVTLLAPTTIFPYFGFRWFLHVTGSRAREMFPVAVIWAGILTSILGIIETIGGKNPILPAQTLNAAGTPQVWDVPLRRNGLLRADSTFGHPIAFGMFLLIPLAFAASRPGKRYLLATGIILAGELVTLSRGPWLGAAAVMLILSRWNRKRIAAAVAITAVAVFVIPPLHSLILQSGGTSSESGATAHYRIGLITGAFHHLTFFGHGNADITVLIPGFADVTSWLAVNVLSRGVIGLVQLIVLVLLVGRLVLVARRDGSRDYLAAAAAVAGQLVGLLTVTLITSYEFFFWASLAYLVAVSEAARHRTTAWPASPPLAAAA